VLLWASVRRASLLWDRWAIAASSDPRSLAAARIALGLLVLVDCGQRAGILRDFYTDAGFVPRSTALEIWSHVFPNAPPPWSLHALSGTLGWQSALLAVEVAAALAFTLGYRARLAAILSFVLFLSHSQRNVLVCEGQDWAMVAFLMWSMFAPLDRAWALGRTKLSGRVRPLLEIGSLAFTAQLLMLLFFAGLQKLLNSESWRNGEAISIVLGLELGIKPLGRWLRELPWPILHAVNYSVLLSEIVAPWLTVAPIARRFRTLAVGFIALHLLAFSASLEVGLLPWVVLAALLSRLPGTTWDALGLRHTDAFLPDASRSTEADRAATLASVVAVIGLVHALLLNLFRLGGEYAGPAWLDAPSGFLVPRQGWRMFSTAERSWKPTWVVLAARRTDDGGTQVRLPDGASLAFDLGSSAEVLFENLRYRVLWGQIRPIAEAHPEILVRILSQHCERLPIREVDVVLVERAGTGFSTSPLGRYRCGERGLLPPSTAAPPKR
jgi:hypothetical protein